MDRVPVTLSQFSRGVDSLLHPSFLGNGQYAWGENVVNRGGIIQTRPGYRFRRSMLGAKAQGFCLFTPRNSTPRMVAVVDGVVYVARWPNFEFTPLAGIQLSAAADQVYFCKAWRSVETKVDGTLSLITPTPILFIQDGRNRCAFWDGTTARHTNPDALNPETPQGTWMAWSGSRLWVISGTIVKASNLGDPLTFTENTYIAERSNFELPDEGTGIIETASAQGLLLFTRHTITAVKSTILDRTQWALTPNFQEVIVKGSGTQAGRSVINQYGKTWFFSERGFISVDAAMNAERSSELLTEDEGMTRSKRKLSSNLEGICAAAPENMLLLSVPHGSRYNSHTWALDQAPMGAQSPSAWQGIWTGARPVEWATGFIGGRDRTFFLAFDKTPKDDTHIHVWEAMDESREDGAGGRIACFFETPIIPIDKLSRFKYAEIEVVEMLGAVDLEIYVRGEKGPWVPIGTKKLQAEKGSINSYFQPILTKNSIIKSFKPQARTVRSIEFPATGVDCTPETSGTILGIDKGFAILCRWRGRMGVTKIKLFFDPSTVEQKVGTCEKSEAGDHNAITDGGVKVVEVEIVDYIPPVTPPEEPEEPEEPQGN